MLASSAHDDHRTRDDETLRRSIDPTRPLDTLVEEEPNGLGDRDPALTIFLAGSECPLSCVFCDLSKYTLLEPTAPGAIAGQIRTAIAETPRIAPGRTTLKLYNASNFFEDRAVPPSDDERILELVAPFRRVVVECHPRWIRQRFERYAEALGDRLEIAMGLETAHPEAFSRLGKGIDIADFDAAAREIRRAGATLRVFALVGAPFVPESDALGWVERTVQHAAELGARFVSLIPLRTSPRLEAIAGTAGSAVGAVAGGLGHRSMTELERCLETSLHHAPIVTLDLWDLDPGSIDSCGHCFAERKARLEEMQTARVIPDPIACERCGSRREAS